MIILQVLLANQREPHTQLLLLCLMTFLKENRYGIVLLLSLLMLPKHCVDFIILNILFAVQCIC